MADLALDQQPDQQADLLKGSGARSIARGAIHKTPEPLLQEVTDDTSYNAVPMGKDFRDPQGNIRTKPWVVKEDSDFDLIPEGAEFTDPEGNVRIKPSYENVSFTSQTLYDMAVNDKERQKALERSYPGKVKQLPSGEFVVDDDGTPRKPRRFGDEKATGTTRGALALAGALPTAGAVAGEIGGGLAGSVLPGPGTFAGAVAGGGLGAAVGQGFNDLVLQLAGVYDRSTGEEAGELALAGAFGAGGSALGRGIAALGGGKDLAKRALPGAAAKFLGADAEGLETAVGLADKGVLVPPSGWAKEAPHIQNVVEVFDPAFHTQKPLLQSATEHYEDTAKGILDTLGIKTEGSISKPTEAVPVQAAGERVMAKTLAESKAADDELNRILQERKAAAGANLPGRVAQRDELTRAAEQSRQAAQRLIDQGYREIEQSASEAARVSGSGHNGGDLWEAVGARLQAVRRGLQERASLMYRQADELAGGHLPNTEGLPELAGQFADQLPEEFQRNQPALVRQLREMANRGEPPVPEGHVRVYRGEGGDGRMASEVNGGYYTPDRSAAERYGSGTVRFVDIPEGEMERFSQNRVQVVKFGEPEVLFIPEEPRPDKISYRARSQVLGPAQGPTFGQLHNLRSQIRQNTDFYRLNSDIKNGTYKFFARRVDEALRDTVSVPELGPAVEQLNRADAFYRENMPVFEAQQIKAIMRGLEAGEPADPGNLFKTVVKEGHTDLTNRIRGMVGPNLWAGVQAADLREMFQASRGLRPDEIDGRAFTREVLERHRSGVLEAVHSREVGQRLLQQAQAVAMLDGRLSLPVRPGDTLTDVISRARLAAEQAKAAAKADPLRTLQGEMKVIERDHQALVRKNQQERKNDPLGFLYDPTTGAAEATNKILGNEDLVLAAAARFGEASPEFNMLRQVYVQRVLQGTMEPGAKLAKISPEVQQIMFPGVTLDQMHLLAKEMDFLMSSRGAQDTAKSMAAVSKVEHPWSSIPLGRAAGKLIPGFDAAGRTMLGSYYKLVRKLSTSPAFLRWVQKGLKGDEAARLQTKEQVQRLMQKGGAAGAGAGESQLQSTEGMPSVPGEPALERRSSLDEGRVMSDVDERPVAGQQYAMMDKSQLPGQGGLTAEIDKQAGGFTRGAAVPGPGRGPVGNAVQKLKEGLHAEDRTQFPAAFERIKTMSTSEIKDIAKEFVGRGGLGRQQALDKIWQRFQALETVRAKSRAVGGRSAG